jgi:glycosyltransferase involved in cell wall biosynthesis
VAPTIVAITSTINPVGGAEKVLLVLLRGFSQYLGADIEIVSHLPSDAQVPWVYRCSLRRPGESAGVRMILRLRAVLLTLQPGTILFPFQIRSNILTAIANRSLPLSRRLRVVANDRVSIDALFERMRREPGGTLRALIFRFLARWAYRRSDAIVCNSEANAAFVRMFLAGHGPPVATIYNPVLAARLTVAFPERERLQLAARPLLTAHGRLALDQKGWDTLLESFALVRQAVPGVRLRLVGDGPDRNAILRQASRLGVKDALELTGFAFEPYSLIEEGDIYVLPSRWEGLPNALLEAMALGLPVVATDCPTGPREILEGGEHGVLVPVDDVPTLAAALVSLLRDDERRSLLASRARRRALDFDLGSAVARYSALFANLVNAPEPKRGR